MGGCARTATRLQCQLGPAGSCTNSTPTLIPTCDKTALAEYNLSSKAESRLPCCHGGGPGVPDRRAVGTPAQPRSSPVLQAWLTATPLLDPTSRPTTHRPEGEWYMCRPLSVWLHTGLPLWSPLCCQVPPKNPAAPAAPMRTWISGFVPATLPAPCRRSCWTSCHHCAAISCRACSSAGPVPYSSGIALCHSSSIWAAYTRSWHGSW